MAGRLSNESQGGVIDQLGGGAARGVPATVQLEALEVHPNHARFAESVDSNGEFIERLCSEISAAGEMPADYAVRVTREGGAYYVVDGRLRLEAARRAKITEIPIRVANLSASAREVELLRFNADSVPLAKLEMGLYIYRAVLRAQGKSGEGLQRFANALDMNRANLSRYRDGAEVFEAVGTSCNVTRAHTRGLISKCEHLAAIHKAPRGRWVSLVEGLIREDWSLRQTKTKVDEVLQLERDLDATESSGSREIRIESANSNDGNRPSMSVISGGKSGASGASGSRGNARDESSIAYPENPVSREGEVLLLGEHRLMCGDATESGSARRLAAGKRADVVWTDCPWGVRYTGKTRAALQIQGDTPDAAPQLLADTLSVATDEVVSPGSPYYVVHPGGELSIYLGLAVLKVGWKLRQTLVWVKNSLVLGHSDYHYRHESMFYGYVPGGKGRLGRGGYGWYGDNAQDTVFEFASPRASRGHPTTKPVGLVEACLLNSTRHGDYVYDPFGGSGSTLMACERLGRKGLVMETDEGYCDVICTRYQLETGRWPVVEATGEPRNYLLEEAA